MSTPLKDLKLIANVSRNVAAFISNAQEQEVLKPLADKIVKQLKSLQIVSAKAELGLSGQDAGGLSQLAKDIFQAAARTNIESHKKRYASTFAEPEHEIVKEMLEQLKAHEKEFTQYVNTWKDLGGNTMPHNHQSYAFLAEAVCDVQHGLDDDGLYGVFDAIKNSYSSASILVHPEYESLGQLDPSRVADAVSKVAGYGDQTLGMQSAYRTITGEMGCSGTYESENFREYYPEDVIGTLVLHKYPLEGEYKPQIPYQGLSSDDGYNLLLRKYRTFTANIASDVPRPTDADFLIVSKAFSEVAELMQDNAFIATYKEGYPDANFYALENVAKRMQSVSQRYDKNYVSSFAGAKRYWTFDHVKGHEPEFS
ncbi:hypothetical protein AB4254_12185 [Vibrio breoganii]